jgi:putative glutamine amidotransferase
MQVHHRFSGALGALSFVISMGHASMAYGAGAHAQASAQAPASVEAETTTLVITHPTESVLRNYVTLVRQGVLKVPNLRIIGIYHELENEDYAAGAAYLKAEKIDWITTTPIHCDVTADTVYADNSCRTAIEPILAQAQGMVFNGGDDIPPYLYGQSTLLTTQVEAPQRHIFETTVLVHMIGSSRAPKVVPLLKKRPDFTLLGICVGMQTFNIAAGGTLFQDIPSQLYHQQSVEMALGASPATWHRNHARERGTAPNISVGVMHPIHLTPHALPFMFASGKPGLQEPLVLSIHHQAVDKLGQGYIVYATSHDGKVIEAMGRHDFPNVLGIQFHPERSAMWQASEAQRLSPVSTEHNFVYDALAHDAYSKALNQGIWTWMADHMLHASRPLVHRS